MSNDIKIIKGSGDVFRDLGFADGDTMRLKANLAGEILSAMKRRRLTNRAAAKLTGIDETDISRIRNADLDRFTIDRLVSVLNRLGRSVEIKVRAMPARRAAAKTSRPERRQSKRTDPKA